MTEQGTNTPATPAEAKAALEAAFALGEQSARAEGAPGEEFSSADWYPDRDRRQPLDVALRAEFEKQGREGIPRRTTANSEAIKEIYRAHGR